jgi:hypothetical protein
VTAPLGRIFYERTNMNEPTSFHEATRHLRGAWKACLLVLALCVSLAGQRPNVHLPDESTGFDGIARTLMTVFDHADIVAIGEDHEQKQDSDLRIALVRNPDFPKKVRSIVVEFASTAEQSTLDRYIRGENVAAARMEKVSKTAGQADGWTSPIYAAFFAAVRDVNSRLPADARIRVLGGDPGPGDYRSRDAVAVSVLKEQVLQKHGKALVIYGAAHFYRMQGDVLLGIGEMTTALEAGYPGRTFVVIPVGGTPLPLLPGVAKTPAPDYRKFDRALKTQVRPVLVALQREPFRGFTADEFIGQKLLNCRGPGGCVSAFKGSVLTLAQMADACVYFGGNAGPAPPAKSGR